MSRYQYKPSNTVRYAPRVSRRFWSRIGHLCRRFEMPESDVLRYPFEAAVLEASRSGKIGRVTSPDPRSLDAKITVRTNRLIGQLVSDLWIANPRVLKVDVLRVLLERGIRMAELHGMSRVMKVREENLKR